jgi:soluble cytochrome b562
MVRYTIKISILALGLLSAASAVAYADCESDLLQLEAAMKAPGQTPANVALMKDAGAKASEALRKDDDAGCNKFVMDVLKTTGAPASAAAPVAASSAPMGDLKPLRSIVDDTLKIAQKGDLPAAKTRIKDLETAWDKARTDLKPKNPAAWDALDKLIDASLKQLRADKPDAKGSADALSALLSQFDKTK